MATFKKFDNQQVKQLPCFVDAEDVGYTADDEIFNVGDVFARNASTGEIAHIESFAEAKQSLDDGMQLYMVAQSDAVTNKTGTAYKTYIVGDGTVTVSTDDDAQSIVVAYVIDHLENVEF